LGLTSNNKIPGIATHAHEHILRCTQLPNIATHRTKAGGVGACGNAHTHDTQQTNEGRKWAKISVDQVLRNIDRSRQACLFASRIQVDLGSTTRLGVCLTMSTYGGGCCSFPLLRECAFSTSILGSWSSSETRNRHIDTGRA
jgi:hypothetical protein